MVISQAQRAEAAVTQMLSSARDGGVAARDLRTALEMSRAIASKLIAFQARAAAVLAARESHGDGGAGVLRHATGVPRRQAEGRVRAVRVLDDLPAVRDALEEGKVSFANAARLAEAAEAAGGDVVQADAGLLSDAESMSDDQFAREARRWTARNRPDGGEADYARRRARRWLRIWDGDDGMTQLRGELDPMTGERIRNRLEAEARRLRRSDSRDERRSFPQAMADALDGVTAAGNHIIQSGAGSSADSRDASGADSRDAGGADSRAAGPGADTHGAADGHDASRDADTSSAGGTGNRGAEGRGSGSRGDPDNHEATDHSASRDADTNSADGHGDSDAGGRDAEHHSGGNRGDPSNHETEHHSGGNRGDPGIADVRWSRPIADIAVVSYVDTATGDLVSQLATGEPLPPSVLEQLACNASITGILYDTAGTPLWRGTAKPTATAAQRKALIARDGGCVGCHCHPALCQAHHIRPVSQGGPTRISNMVLVCWNCHYKIHHHQWTVVRRHGRFGLLPPVRTRWGPAHAPDPATEPATPAEAQQKASKRRDSQREAPGRQDPQRETSGRRDPQREAPGQRDPRREAPGRRDPRRETSGRRDPQRKTSGRQDPRREAPGQRDSQQEASQPEPAPAPAAPSPPPVPPIEPLFTLT